MEARESVDEFIKKRDEAERLLAAPMGQEDAESRVSRLLRDLGQLGGRLGGRGGEVIIVGPKPGSGCVQYKVEDGRHCVLIAEERDSSGRTIKCTYRCEDEPPDKLPEAEMETVGGGGD